MSLSNLEPTIPVWRVAAELDLRSAWTFEPRPLARLGALIRARALDRALAAGVDPARSRWLAARAARLSSTRTRRQLARTLRRIATRPAPGRWRVAPSTRATEAAQTHLLDLADLLQGHSPVYPRGVAMLDGLLRDGTGPVFTDPDGAELTQALTRVRQALESESV